MRNELVTVRIESGYDDHFFLSFKGSASLAARETSLRTAQLRPLLVRSREFDSCREDGKIYC